jgi:HAD superfamily hydrolase (TIGR01509 family)
MIKAIFFDLDGVFFAESLKSSVKQYEQEFSIPDGEFLKIIHDHQAWKEFTLGKITQVDFFKVCSKRAGNYVFNPNRFMEIMSDNAVINYQLAELAGDLSKKYIVGIISNRPKEWYRILADKYGLREIFKVEMISGLVGIRKPAKEMFQLALDQAQVKGEEAIYVDDRPERVEGALSLGIRVITYNNFAKFILELNNLLTDQ